MRVATVLALACVCAVHTKQKSHRNYLDKWSRFTYPTPQNHIYHDRADSIYDSSISNKSESIPDSQSILPPSQHRYGYNWNEIDTPRQLGSRDHHAHDLNHRTASSKYDFLELPAESARQRYGKWQPPAYHQALADYTNSVKKVKSYFDAFTKNNKKIIRYIALINAVANLAKHVAYNGWETYDDAKGYNVMVGTSIKEAVNNPERTIKELRCMVALVYARIEKVANVVREEAVSFVCKSQSEACDTVVETHVQITKDKKMNEAAHVLLSLGVASGTFLRKYADKFDAISNSNVYKYVTGGKDQLRPLVKQNAEWIVKAFPNQNDIQCGFKKA